MKRQLKEKLIDNSGNVKDNYTYDTFGNLVFSTGTQKVILEILAHRFMGPVTNQVTTDFYYANV